MFLELGRTPSPPSCWEKFLSNQDVFHVFHKMHGQLWRNVTVFNIRIGTKHTYYASPNSLFRQLNGTNNLLMMYSGNFKTFLVGGFLVALFIHSNLLAVLSESPFEAEVGLLSQMQIAIGKSNLTLTIQSCQIVNGISKTYAIANIFILGATFVANSWAIRVILRKERIRINQLIVWDCLVNMATMALLTHS